MEKPFRTTDISYYIHQDYYSKYTFLGVFPIDKLPSIIHYPCSFVFNTHPSNKPGEHWISVFYDTYMNCTFFDSFGFSPQDYKVDDYIKKTSKSYEWNKNQIQHVESSMCGFYCIYFIYLKSRGYSLQFINQLFVKKQFKQNDFFMVKCFQFLDELDC